MRGKRIFERRWWTSRQVDPQVAEDIQEVVEIDFWLEEAQVCFFMLPSQVPHGTQGIHYGIHHQHALPLWLSWTPQPPVACIITCTNIFAYITTCIIVCTNIVVCIITCTNIVICIIICIIINSQLIHNSLLIMKFFKKLPWSMHIWKL